MLQVKHLLHILQTPRTSTLFEAGGGGGGEGVDLVKAVCVFQVNFKFDTKIRETREVSQNL